MPKYVAFLRAINVGGHVVKMDHLRSLFEANGFVNVETFIASGNVIFDSAAKKTAPLELKIETQLHKALGYPVATFVRSISELTAVTDHQPFGELTAGNNLYIAFLRDEPTLALQSNLLSFKNAIDDFRIHRRELYWLRRTQLGESVFSGALIEKTLGSQVTVRNSTTVRRIAQKYLPKHFPRSVK